MTFKIRNSYFPRVNSHTTPTTPSAPERATYLKADGQKVQVEICDRTFIGSQSFKDALSIFQPLPKSSLVSRTYSIPSDEDKTSRPLLFLKDALALQARDSKKDE